MNNSDSVSLFSEGTFEEQVQELVTYLARSHSDTERPSFVQPFQDAVKSEAGQKPFAEDVERRRLIISKVVEAVDGLGDGSEKEIEGFFNLIFGHVCNDFPAASSDFSRHLLHLVRIIVEDSSAEHTQLKLRILANLYNCVPRTSQLRMKICEALLSLATQNDDIDALHLSLPDVERWLSEWDINEDAKSNFLKTIADSYSTVNRPETAYTYRIAYVQSLPSSSSSSTAAALDLLASALRLPTVFDFDTLLKLDNVKLLSSHQLFTLLQIFAKGGIPEYQEWEAKNESLLRDYHLDKTQLIRKLRLLIFASIGFQKIGQKLSYSEISEVLQIAPSEVEKWSIDVMRAGLLSGKLSQTSQTLYITRSSPRGFSSEHWRVLEQRLLAWKTGLSGIQAVLASALQSSNPTSGNMNGFGRHSQEQVA